MDGDLAPRAVRLCYDPHVIDFAAVFEIEKLKQAGAMDPIVKVGHRTPNRPSEQREPLDRGRSLPAARDESEIRGDGDVHAAGRTAPDSDARAERFAGGTMAGATFLDESSSAERNLLTQEELSRISARLTELPANWRRAFIMHVLLDRSTRDIAAEMNVSDRMVRNYVTRGLLVCQVARDEMGKAHDH